MEWRFFSTLDRVLAALLKATVVAASILVVALLFALVLIRYVFGGNFLSGHELSLLFAMLLYMCGAVIASRNSEHLTVDFLQQSLRTERARAIHGIVVAMVTLVVCIFFLVWAYWMFAWGVQRPQTTPVLRIPLWIPQLSILIAAVGCFSYALRDLLRGIRALVK